jgi:hypothetical protein
MGQSNVVLHDLSGPTAICAVFRIGGTRESRIYGNALYRGTPRSRVDDVRHFIVNSVLHTQVYQVVEAIGVLRYSVQFISMAWNILDLDALFTPAADEDFETLVDEKPDLVQHLTGDQVRIFFIEDDSICMTKPCQVE